MVALKTSARKMNLKDLQGELSDKLTGVFCFLYKSLI